MNLAKFLNLLLTSKLYFPRADLLGDPFEGSQSLANVRSWDSLLADEAACKRAFPDMGPDGVRFMRDQMSLSLRDNLPHNFVSCWHAAEHESAAMWRLYGREGEAIAVQTTFEKLATALPTEVHMGAVRYINYEREFIDPSNLFNVLMTKRRSFEHEKEVRAILWSRLPAEELSAVTEFGEHGAHVHVDLAAIMERIYVGPTAPAWFADVVRAVVSANGFETPVLQSSLAATPVF